MPHFFVGDSAFSGLQPHSDTGDGRSYRSTSHVVYRSHYDIDMTTVVLSDDPSHIEHNFSLVTVVHELGHVIHEILDFDDCGFPNVSEYAQTNDHENFAEAITAWIVPFGWGYGESKDVLSRDDYRCIESFMLEDEDALWRPAWTP